MAVHSYSSFELNMFYMSSEINAKRCSIASVFEYNIFNSNLHRLFQDSSAIVLLYPQRKKYSKTQQLIIQAESL